MKHICLLDRSELYAVYAPTVKDCRSIFQGVFYFHFYIEEKKCWLDPLISRMPVLIVS